MSLILSQTYSAVGPGITSSFGASNGAGPYSYAVRTGGAGGSIDPVAGLYTAPANAPTVAAQQFDTIVATDTLGVTGTATIMVGDPLLLFCDVIQNQLGLANGRVYLWDQKVMQPTDNGLYVAVSVLSCKPFGNTNAHANNTTGGLNSNASVNMWAQLQVDIMSRDNSARVLKEAVILALNSDYAQQQQEANGFYIGKLPPGAQFTNLSQQDGAAIPYRFVISVSIQYVYTAAKAVGYMSAQPVTVNYVQK